MNQQPKSLTSRGSLVASAQITLAACLLFVVALKVCAQHTARDTDLKATLLFNFSQFSQWPPGSLGPTNAPFVIGIIGADPFGKFIDDLVANEHVEGHRIQIRRFTTATEATAAKIVFIPHSELKHAPSILSALDNKPILTVCELPDRSTGTQGCVIALVNKENTIRIRINLDAARKTGIVISSKVLHFAEITQAK